jgi:23S rRNA (cytosine1962-C5)-methyltransferase
MAREGARSVLLVDSSEHALDLAGKAAALNEVGDRVTLERNKAQNVLQRLIEEKHHFGVVVLDPPALVPKKKDTEKGLQRYAALNSAGLDLLEPGGLLVTCSCSQHVGESDFEDMLLEAAHRSEVQCQEIYRGGQGPDHPVLHPHFESRYLKCRVLRVV